MYDFRAMRDLGADLAAYTNKLREMLDLVVNSPEGSK
jgi:hypothetical protein